MALSLITPATSEPITVAEAKAHLRLGSSSGEPAPTAPTLTLVAAAGNVTAGAHRVCWTFKTTDGETEAGAVSAPVTADAGHGQITSTVPVGGSAVTAWVCYMTAAGGATYLKVAEITTYAATYTINVADGSLGVSAPATNTTEDPILVRLIAAVTERCELGTQRAMMPQTWDLVVDSFPDDGWIEIPKPPLVSVTHLKYQDTYGVVQTWAASNYVVDAPAGPRCRRGRLSLAYNVSWPSTYGEMGDVSIRFVCGYASASAVPELLKSAMLRDLTMLYERRDNVITGTIVDTLPNGVADIYRSYRSHARQMVRP